jgi:hypothetical protein
MDLSYIDWPSFRGGLAVGLGAWVLYTVLKSGWTTIESDDRFDVFGDDDQDVCLSCRLDINGRHPHVPTVIRRSPGGR